MRNLFLLIISALLGALGQILLKKAASICDISQGYLRYFFYLICNGYAWCGAISYFVSLALYMVALNGTELSIARSVSAFSYVLVIIISYFIFKDSITLLKVIGMLFITVGIFILGISGK